MVFSPSVVLKDFLKVDPDILVRQSSECKDYLLEAYRYHLKDERGEENERSRPRQPIPLSKVISMLQIKLVLINNTPKNGQQEWFF